MIVKYFIGLILKSNTPVAQKLDEYRLRFDPKSLENKYLHMSLLPPFVANQREIKRITHNIEEEVDTFFNHEMAENSNLVFKKLDIYNNRRRILYLEPTLPTDLEYLKEGLEELLFDLIPEYKRQHLKEKCFLSLGRFNDPLLLNSAIDMILDDFKFPMELEIESLALFERRDGIWRVNKTLLEFETVVNPFLEEKIYI